MPFDPSSDQDDAWWSNLAPLQPSSLASSSWPPPTSIDLQPAPAWPFPQSPFSPPAQLSSSAAPLSIDGLSLMFPRDPSMRDIGGLFPYYVDAATFGPANPPDTVAAPSQPAQSALSTPPPATLDVLDRYLANLDQAVLRMRPWLPPSGIDLHSSPGQSFPQSLLPPVAQLSSSNASAAVGYPPLTSSSQPTGLSDSLLAPAPAAQSVLSTQPPATLNLLDRYLANLDQAVERLSVPDLPISKSGGPFIPPPARLSITAEQWLAVARLVAPNLVGYFTDQSPPPITPNSAGKLPTVDYAPGALFEAASSLLPWLEAGFLAPLGRAAASAVAEGPPATAANIVSEIAAGVVASPILDRAALLRLNAGLGRTGEEAVGIPANAAKPGILIPGPGIWRFPDRVTGETLEEVKNVKYLAFTQQLRDYFAYAQDNNLTFILHVRPDTKYSGPLQQLIDSGQIKLRHIPRRSQ